MPASVEDTTVPALHLTCACDLDQVRPLTQAAREFLSEHALTEEEMMAAELALTEACNNAVLYATDRGKLQPIEVEMFVHPTRLEIRVHDHTIGFEMPEEVALPEHESETGRGLFIMKSLMDEATYTNGYGQNTLTLIKKRAEHDAPAAMLTAPEYKKKLEESEQIINEMAEELTSCYESLSVIFRCGAELGKTENLEHFTKSICNDILRITESDWFALRVVPPFEKKLDVFAASAQAGVLSPVFFTSADQAVTSAEVRAGLTKQHIWFDRKNPLHPADPLYKIGADGSGLIRPFYFAESLLGTLTVGKKQGRPRFTAAQSNVVQTLADFLGIQIANMRLREEHVANRLFSHELAIAKNIQRTLLPKRLPRLDGFGLSGHCESARQVGGDFYDVIEITNNSVLLVIADVMGKGVPAAMFAAIVRSLVRAAPEIVTQPAALLNRVNRLIFQELSEVDMFVTAQLAYVDTMRRELITASAGHCPLLIYSPDQPGVKSISADGMPLGIIPDCEFIEVLEPLPKASRILLYTDGMTDTQDAEGTFFGQTRLFQALSKPNLRTAEEICNHLASEITKFRGTANLYDDQTFLLIAEET